MSYDTQILRDIQQQLFDLMAKLDSLEELIMIGKSDVRPVITNEGVIRNETARCSMTKEDHASTYQDEAGGEDL